MYENFSYPANCALPRTKVKHHYTLCKQKWDMWPGGMSVWEKGGGEKEEQRKCKFL